MNSGDSNWPSSSFPSHRRQRKTSPDSRSQSAYSPLIFQQFSNLCIFDILPLPCSTTDGAAPSGAPLLLEDWRWASLVVRTLPTERRAGRCAPCANSGATSGWRLKDLSFVVPAIKGCIYEEILFLRSIVYVWIIERLIKVNLLKINNILGIKNKQTNT